MGYSYKIPRRGVQNISDHIVSIILRVLPVKSLLRFRCVSKHWRSLIDDPSFVDMHRIRSSHRHKFLVDKAKKTNIHFCGLHQRQEFMLMDFQEENMTAPAPAPVLVPNPSPNSSILHIGEGVQGLICCGDIIWNPTTRKIFRLPNQHLNHINISIPIGIGVNFPTIQNFYYLGFDSQTKQYKVLSISYVGLLLRKYVCNDCLQEARASYHKEICNTKFHMQVLTLGVGSWRDITHRLPQEPTHKNLHSCQSSLYLNNQIFILVQHPQYFALLIFLVGEESFKFVPVPEECNRPWCRLYYKIIEVRGCVALMAYLDSTTMKIWRLIDVETEKWEANVVDFSEPLFSSTNNKSIIVCTVDHSDDILVQLEEDKRCFYWNTKKGGTRKWPKADVKILSKHIETLFDPTTL